MVIKFVSIKHMKNEHAEISLLVRIKQEPAVLTHFQSYQNNRKQFNFINNTTNYKRENQNTFNATSIH